MATTENEPIVFADGAAYERYMGQWSRRVGEAFLGWLAPLPGLRWLDVGCGNGAFTELIFEHCTPAAIEGIDPSEEQLAFARTRPAARLARFTRAGAAALPFPPGHFDAAIMPLVLFFVPDPAQGVAEMVRVVRPGGIVAAYVWDMEAGGFPYGILQSEMRAMGVAVPAPPSPEASRLEVLDALWSSAGLENVETRTVTVERTFPDFDDYWSTVLGGPSVGARLAAMTTEDQTRLRTRLKELLPTDTAGRISYTARATAVKGRAPE